VLETYALDDAAQAIVCLGSTAGTVKDALDALRGEGDRVGLAEIRSFRPFPAAELADALAHVKRAVVLDRADSPGGSPPLFAEVAAALHGSDAELRSVVYGLGGRDIHPDDIRGLLDEDGARTYLGLRGEACLA
jgi:pyruvate ferredoxin oxidoreductase alpha subunit